MNLAKICYLCRQNLTQMRKRTMICHPKIEQLALPFSCNYERTFSDILQIQNEWNAEKQKVEINQDALDLINYMSDEIAKEVEKPMDYFKIANFVYYVLYINTKTKDADGLIYPSVAAAGEGFNIVLKPDVVDRKLRFYGASLCYLVKDKMEAVLHVVNQAIGCSDDGTLNTFLRDFWVLQIKSLIANRLNKGIPGRSKPQNTPIFSELLTSGVKVGLSNR